jgi:acyl phosphate:glycerol-3-phosphate acyltransferase
MVLVAAYLLGSIPFSYLVARLFGVPDVRTVGSGNVGATNVMRAAGKTAGLLAFTLDASKGAVAAACAQRLDPGGALPAFAAVAAVLGHMYPVWLSFRGGKGVATGAGAFLPLSPLAAAGGLAGFAIVTALTRYVSLGSCVGALTLAALTFLVGAPPAVCWCAAGSASLIVWKHRANIARLLAGTERRLGVSE